MAQCQADGKCSLNSVTIMGGVGEKEGEVKKVTNPWELMASKAPDVAWGMRRSLLCFISHFEKDKEIKLCQYLKKKWSDIITLSYPLISKLYGPWGVWSLLRKKWEFPHAKGSQGNPLIHTQLDEPYNGDTGWQSIIS